MSPKPLKIAIVSDAVLPFHSGGKEARIDHLAQELLASKQDITIYTMKWWDGGNTYQHQGITYKALCKLYPLYIGKRRSIKEGIMFGLGCLKLITADFDVLEVDHMPYFPLFSAKLVSVIRRKRLFATWHEVVGLRAWRHYMGFVPGTIAAAIERLAILLPNHILAVSDHTYKQLRSTLHYKGSLSLVANGIDYKRIEPIAAAETKSDIIYVGRLVSHKHVDMLIEAVGKLKVHIPEVKCLIIGDGPEYQRLQQLVVDLKLQNNVHLSGRIQSSDDVFACMKASRILASPSTREGFGITILEAYACNLHVLTVKHQDNAAQYLVTKDTGIVCEPTVTAITSSLETLLTSKTYKAPLAIDASTFDWSERAKALKEAYSL